MGRTKKDKRNKNDGRSCDREGAAEPRRELSFVKPPRSDPEAHSAARHPEACHRPVPPPRSLPASLPGHTRPPAPAWGRHDVAGAGHLTEDPTGRPAAAPLRGLGPPAARAAAVRGRAGRTHGTQPPPGPLRTDNGAVPDPCATPAVEDAAGASSAHSPEAPALSCAARARGLRTARRARPFISRFVCPRRPSRPPPQPRRPRRRRTLRPSQGPARVGGGARGGAGARKRSP